MNRRKFLCSLATIVTFAAGFCMSQIMHSNDQELINLQRKALDNISEVVWNNNLTDADGSDEMADYLHLCVQIDSIESAR